MTNVAKGKREMIFIGVTASIVRETEKAYQVEVQYWTKADQPVKKAKMWVPKSCSKVEDGKVTQIADFILWQWEKEHLEYIKSFSSLTAAHTRIDFDIARKDELVRREKEKKAAYKKHIDDTIAKYLPTVTKSCKEMLSEYGTVAQIFGRIWKEDGIDGAFCDEFIAWGKVVNEKYGEVEGSESKYEFLQRVKNYNERERQILYHDYSHIWVFGDFRPNDSQRDFFEIKDFLIHEKFKKECAIGREFRDFLTRHYGYYSKS